MRFTQRAVMAAVVMGALGASPVGAQILLRTGVDATNTPLADMALDPYWSISLNGGSTFAAARVAPPSVICCSMQNVPNTAKWISDQSVNPNSVNTGWGVNNLVTFKRSFDLTGYDISTVFLTGSWSLADNRSGVYLNGSLIDAATNDGANSWFVIQPIAAGSSFFTTGTNTIELRGTSQNSQWDAVWLDATVSGRVVATPEPASLALFATGLLTLGLVRKRRA